MGRKPCCEKEGMNRGAWTAQEDQILSDYIHSYGEGKWNSLPKRAGLKRCGKSCRLRWLNYLRPDIKRGNITRDEEDLIVRLHKLLGNRWSLIAGRLPGRTDNEIKNYWNTNLSKKLEAEATEKQQTSSILNPTKKMRLEAINPPIQGNEIEEQQYKSAPIKTTAFKFANNFSVQDHGHHQRQLMVSPSPDYFTNFNTKFGFSEPGPVAGEGGGDGCENGFLFSSGVQELKECDFGDDFNFLNELLDSEGGWIGDL